MIMTQIQRDTMRRRQLESERLLSIIDPSKSIYKDVDLKGLANKIYWLHEPSSQDIECCLKTYLGGIVS